MGNTVIDRWMLRAICIFAFLPVAARGAWPCSLGDGADILVRNTTIVDVRSGETRPNRSLAIDDGRICDIREADDSLSVRAETTIDGTGLFLVPGLMEMHAHVASSRDMTLYLANGVTTVRNLWGEVWSLELREQLAAEKTHYPRFLTAGPIVDGAPPVNYPFVVVSDPRDAAAEVARQAAAGYDFVKVYSNLSPAAFDAVIAAGERYDIEISGHLPHAVRLPHALDAGMRSMEHFLEVADELLRYPPATDLDLYVVYPETEQLLAAIGRGDIDLDQVVDRTRIPDVAEHAGKSNTWFDPTLMPMRNFTSDWNRRNPDWDRYLSPATKAYWQRAWAARKNWSEDARRGEDALYALRLELLGAMQDAGAGILTGTDAPVPGMYPGFSLVDEIEQLTRAGLSNGEALRAATLEGARYLGREGELGEVLIGAEADLVLVRENPLEDLQHLRSVAGVIKAGYWHSAEDLTVRLDSVASYYAGQEALFRDAPEIGESREADDDKHVRTTAVRVTNEVVDFVRDDAAARLLAIENGETVKIALAVGNADGTWSLSDVSVAPDRIQLSLPGGRELDLIKKKGVWTLNDGDEEIWSMASDGFVLPLTGTPVDIVLVQKLRTWVGRTSTPLHLWPCRLDDGCTASPVAAYLEETGFEKINAVFIGVERVDISARGLGTSSLWIGAGPFYGGQPVRLKGHDATLWDRLR
jgi:imidazolonepropionase-like amidohydrolase